MASSAPQEILSIIAHHLAQLDKKLSPYALVNKSWQAAFERQIYSSIVVRSPSDVTTVKVKEHSWTAPGGPHPKHGLPLDTFIKVTSGPESWQRARRLHVRQILYRVAVPYWLDEDRGKGDDYTYDNAYRRENNRAFSKGVCQLFEHLSTWTNQAISLQIALQAEDASTDEECGEPGSIPWRGTRDEIASYCAEFVPGYSLPRASCITSLDFPKLLSPETIWVETWALDMPCDENEISLPARLSIASACSALENIRLDLVDEIPSSEPNMRSTWRTAAAQGFSQLPRTIKDMTLYRGDSGRLDESAKQLQMFTKQLRHLRIESLEIFRGLFCPDGLGLPVEAHWPYLETLHLKDQYYVTPPFHGELQPAYDLIRERYLNNLYTNLGHAAQKMPCLKSVILTFRNLDHELELSIKNQRHNLTLCVMDNYQPSLEFLEAWKVPGGSLQPCINKFWKETTYPSWPPS
ncbi:hypothetical protein D6D13_09725 [Aureobasidium pullulans]|uniref:Uncharacterized protein n=1 Tax=Aureobasidium pullulans TaxID=5580 RepID=A0A4S9C0X7_AURPU|nr:hypothetical protein D6D13_09725 [Aureobasidium pullulans]